MMVILLPHWIPICGENEGPANLIEVQSPICVVAMLWVLKGAEIFGMAAVRVPIFRLNGEGVNAVDGYFHVLGWLTGWIN